MAAVVPSLIRFSLVLFFSGLYEYLLGFTTTIGFIMIVPISCCGLFFLYGMLVPHLKLQSPLRTLLLWPIFFLMQTFQRSNYGDRSLSLSGRMEACQERVVMGETDECKDRDVRAIRWLIDSSAVNVKMEPLVLAIPGSFNTEWGKDVWREVSSQARDTFEPSTALTPADRQASLIPLHSHPLDGAADVTISRCVRNLFETCNNHSHFESDEARRRRMRVCVEAVASLVCCFDFRLASFGDVGRLVSEIGHIERIGQSPTGTTGPSFVVRWTCLALLAIRQILNSNPLRAHARCAVSGLVRIQQDFGQSDAAELRSVQKIEDCLKTAWERVEELRRAFEPWTQKRTREEVKAILQNHEGQISELKRMADGMEDVDWRFSLYQDEMDDATYKLMRQLPGVTFDELRRSESSLISETFNPPATSGTFVTPQLIFPGQRVQVLARLGVKLRQVMDGQVAEGYEKVLKSLESVDQVPVSRRRPDGFMKRQLWRLQDLRDGGGLGFTVELFFLSLRQLPLHESNSVFYTGTFKIITSHWVEGVKSLGTQCTLLNIISDLIIRGRGDLSDVSFPEPITAMLLDMIEDIIQNYAGPDQHVRDAVLEIQSVDSRTCMDMGLRHRALTAIPLPRSQSQSSPS
ncbi:hypothetical protein EI94DRAFT_1808060 [Lactarius quietus]|nr:hypothetical protein EI94DRAFT_1808060 [Lactarius quietus]